MPTCRSHRETSFIGCYWFEMRVIMMIIIIFSLSLCLFFFQELKRVKSQHVECSPSWSLSSPPYLNFPPPEPPSCTSIFFGPETRSVLKTHTHRVTHLTATPTTQDDHLGAPCPTVSEIHNWQNCMHLPHCRISCRNGALCTFVL